jgi:hypothetical protein
MAHNTQEAQPALPRHNTMRETSKENWTVHLYEVSGAMFSFSYPRHRRRIQSEKPVDIQKKVVDIESYKLYYVNYKIS